MIAFLFLLLSSLLLLLYCFQLLSPILLQFSKLLTQTPPSLPLTLISQLPSLVFHPTTNLHPSFLLLSVLSRLLPASVPTMSVLSPSPNCCPATQHLPFFWMPFPILPHFPPTRNIFLLAALSNLVPILSIISSISISSLSLMLLPLQLNLLLALWLTPSLQLGQIHPLLIGVQRMTRTKTPSFC
jgi:hypothetical protein